MKQIIDFFKLYLDATLIILSLVLIGVYGRYTFDDETQAFILREFGERYNSREFYLALFAAMSLPIALVVVSRLFSSSQQKTKMLLRYFRVSFVVVLLLLVYKELIFDEFLVEKKFLMTLDGGLKELFGLQVTLFSFLAGFVLLNSLQEYSQIKRECSEEIHRWQNLYALLDFFKCSDCEKQNSEKSEKAPPNHTLATEAMSLIKDIDASDENTQNSPKVVLSQVYERIVKLTIEDDNDRPALDRLINQYFKLKVLINERSNEENETPNGLLVMILWVVALATILMSAHAVFWTMSVAFSPMVIEPIGRLLMAFVLIIMVLPVSIIILTIGDLQNPFDGLWAIDMKKYYSKL